MKMQNAEMEFIAFDAQDVITSSVTFTFSGLDHVKNSWSFVSSDGSVNFNQDTVGEAALLFSFGGSHDIGGHYVDYDTTFEYTHEEPAMQPWNPPTVTTRSHSLYKVLTGDVNSGDGTFAFGGNDLFNGVYQWIEGQNKFAKIQ